MAQPREWYCEAMTEFREGTGAIAIFPGIPDDVLDACGVVASRQIEHGLYEITLDRPPTAKQVGRMRRMNARPKREGKPKRPDVLRKRNRCLENPSGYKAIRTSGFTRVT